MGQAKVRKRLEAERDLAIAALAPEAQTVIQIARRMHQVGIDPGACYRSSFFLYLFLKEAHGVEGEAVVGYVNDGTDTLYSSHAWFELNGLRTDLALSKPLRPEVQRPGPLVIHGIEFRPGHPWSYHRQMPTEGLTTIMELRSSRNPHIAKGAVEAEELHLTMAATRRSDALIRTYLDAAPDRRDYSKMAAEIAP